MTTRPGYIWSGTEWVAIGQEAIASPFYYQATAPSSPSTGDIWVESDVDVPSIDSALFYRWKKTAVGGETSLSGADDTGLSLQYTPNYEQVFINGVLMVRGSDYIATTGTTITGLTALSAGDIVTVISQVTYQIADTYTQAQSDSKYATTVNFPADSWTNYSPSLVGFSSNPTGIYRYIKLGKTVIFSGTQYTNGTSNSAIFTISLPVTAATITGMVWMNPSQIVDAGASSIGLCWVNSGGTVLNFGTPGTGGFTASGNKRTLGFTITYEGA